MKAKLYDEATDLAEKLGGNIAVSAAHRLKALALTVV
eukprot:SAG25_NODE_7434_length_481_cov_0.547120_2_plen_36_part_01